MTSRYQKEGDGGRFPFLMSGASGGRFTGKWGKVLRCDVLGLRVPYVSHDACDVPTSIPLVNRQTPVKTLPSFSGCNEMSYHRPL